MYNGIPHFYQLKEPIFNFRGIEWYFSFFPDLEKSIMCANIGDPDQTPRIVASGLGLHCLHIFHINV